MQGRRIPDSTFFERRGAGQLEPGDYGVEFITRTVKGVEREDRDWFVVCPDGSSVVLWVNEDDRNGNRHTITEHDDGSITVGGSILAGKIEPAVIIGEGPTIAETWHGYLERGVWREV